MTDRRLRLYYSDTFVLPLSHQHRFPISKYRLLRDRIEASDLLRRCELVIPPGATDEELRLVHTDRYIDAMRNGDLTELEQRRIGFPWSPEMDERSRRSTGATIAAAKVALEVGIAVNLAGGTHHSFPDHGQGYCVFNDCWVAARMLQREAQISRALFVDLDVHQGNGTAAVAAGDDSLFTFSMHCSKNFPFNKTDGDLDVALPPETGDDQYLEELEGALADIEQRFTPDIVFFLAGADPYVGDRLGQLSLTKDGLGKRDRMVFEHFSSRGVPISMAMAGGYAPKIDDIVDIHFATISAAADHFGF